MVCMAVLRFFKMAAFHHLGFLKVQNFKCEYGVEGQCASPCQISHRSFKPLPRYGRWYIFSRWLPSAISDFRNFEILTANTFRRANVRHCAKFRAYRSNHCGNIIVFRFFNMTAVRHLAFVIRLFGPPTKSIWWSFVTVQNSV